MGFWGKQQPRRQEQVQPRWPKLEELHHGRTIASHPSPAAELRRWRDIDRDKGRGESAGERTRMHLGFRYGRVSTSAGPWDDPEQTRGWQRSIPQSHILALGPPRSTAGKTASVLIPVILSQFGPVVAASTKRDIYRATAMARAQQGRLWHYSPDGDTTGLPAAVHEVHWSPLSGSEVFDSAFKTTLALINASQSGKGVSDAGHWKSRALDVLAPLFHWAALTDVSMRRCLDTLHTLDVRGQDVVTDLERVEATLPTARERGATGLAIQKLRGILATPERERGSIVSAAQTALQGYALPAALSSTEYPNFSPDVFVNGGEDNDEGFRADTVYITATSANQAVIAPLVVAFLDQIRQATIRRHRRLEDRGRDAEDVWPVCMVLDELYGLAPLPDLPDMLSAGGGQGLQLVGAVQDLSLLKAKWPEAAGSFRTLFGQTLVFPGIQDPDTLESLSKSCGEYDHTTVSRSEGFSNNQASSNVTESTSRRRRYEPDQIKKGIDPKNPEVVLCLDQGGDYPLDMSPYWKDVPWPQVLTEYLGWALSGAPPQWVHSLRKAGVPVSATEYPERDGNLLRLLPMPELNAWVERLNATAAQGRRVY